MSRDSMAEIVIEMNPRGGTMLYHDAETRLQLAHERADELAREYRRAQKPDADAARQRPERLAHLLSRLRRTRLERRPAYRA